MDLIIQNATLEQITTICSRVAQPSFNELVDDERLEGITQHMVNGDTATEAKYKWQEGLVDKAEETLKEKDGTKTITRDEIKKEMNLDFKEPEAPEVKVETEVKKLKEEKPKDGGLHLDGAPPLDVDTPPELHSVTKKDLVRLAGQLSLSGQRELVREIVNDFGVTRINDLDEGDYKAAFDRMSKAV